jgi:hypothetical protein
MVLSDSKHPAGMLKHIGVADVLVHLAKSQLCCMHDHSFQNVWGIGYNLVLQSFAYMVENVGSDDGCRVALDGREEARFLPGCF